MPEACAPARKVSTPSLRFVSFHPFLFPCNNKFVQFNARELGYSVSTIYYIAILTYRLHHIFFQERRTDRRLRLRCVVLIGERDASDALVLLFA